MKGYALYRGKILPELELLLKPAKELSVDLQIMDPRRLTILVSGDTPHLFIDNKPAPLPDFVIAGFYKDVSYHDIALLQQMESMGVFCVNKAELLKKTGDKLLTLQILAQHGIPIPKTLLVSDNTSLSFVESEFDFPLVLKTNNGTGGNGVIPVKDKDQLSYILQIAKAGNLQKELLIQEMITSSKGRDLRVIIINGKAATCVMRKSADPKNFRSNIACGGSYFPFDMTPEIEAFSNKVAQALGLFVGGIDLLFKEDGFVLCEANSVPAFHNPKGKENVWGIDLPREIIRSIQKALK